MDIVDSQVHLNDIGIENGLAAMTALGIRAAIVDEYHGTEGQRFKPYVLVGDDVARPIQPIAEAAAIAHPDRLAYLIRVEPRDPDLETVVRMARPAPGARALRLCALFPDEVASFARGEHRHVFAIAADHGFPLFVNVGDLTQLDRYLDEFRDAPVILDHCGLAYTPERFEHLLKLARYGNLSLKWAHAPAMLGGGDYPFEALDPKLRRVVDAYGAERVMWASDATENTTGHSWAELLFQVRHSPVLSQEEKSWILGRTVRKVLGWPGEPTA